ncbi:hypothetical protein GF326_06020 [Candidatus Bathyarchaeota archaeon]|nr:hypothetical protein [Candidatus Bathyarchaeota archaeon]
MKSEQLSSSEKRRIYEYMRKQGYSRLTIKILLGFLPDGMDRLTILLGKGTAYDYKLLNDEEFRSNEIQRFLDLASQA